MAGVMDGKAGLVTGAAGGIGRATAVAFAREGAAVVVADLEQRRSDGEETVRLVEADGGRAVFVACDVTRAAEQEALVRGVVERFGALDFAHNNAGVELQALLTETAEPDWDLVMDVNVKGVWLGLKAQIPQMIAHIKALSPARQQELASPQAIKRFGQPEEVAEAVVWLCSDRASFVTGTAMAVDAGSTAGIVLPGVVS
jgi:NAD(P)-dependent dehydrogenase (short-subunit alcohol dehydrogenase family)